MEEFKNNLDSPEDVKAAALKNFFDNLPQSNNGEAYKINRESVELLESAGVTMEMFCSGFVQRGYLLHGTGAGNFAELEPRQAKDEDGTPENVRNAVYATTDPRIPIFMALISRINGRSRYSITAVFDDGETGSEIVNFETSFSIPEDKEGYIYVLPGHTFEPAGADQFTSPVSVKPAYVIPVKLSDFLYPINKINDK